MKFLLVSLCLASATLASAQSIIVSHYASPKDSTLLLTTYVDWDSLTPKTNPNGQSRTVFDNPTATLDKFEVHITSLNPGMSSHPVHRHSWEEILLLRDGELDVSINGHTQHAGPGAFIFFAANDPHNVTNTGSKPATYYVVNFVSDRSHDESAKSAAEQAVPGKLPSSVLDCGNLTMTPTPTGSRAVCVSSPTLTFNALESHITTLNVGQHTASDVVDHNDEFVLIKSGSVEVSVNGIASRMHEGSMLFWPADVKRTLRNVGNTPTSYQVIRVTTDKSPKPTPAS